MNDSLINLSVIEKYQRSIEEDEFNDISQNEVMYGAHVSGAHELEVLFSLLRNEERMQVFADVGAGGTSILHQLKLLHSKVPVILVEPNAHRGNGAIHGWAENLPDSLNNVDLLLLWGTYCFVRSQIETFISVNSVLRLGGYFLMDIVTFTTMPLAQTVNEQSFERWAGMMGFSVRGAINFGRKYHQRVGYLLKKEREFDPSYMRMPQKVGDRLVNFVEERDWFMQ